MDLTPDNKGLKSVTNICIKGKLFLMCSNQRKTRMCQRKD